MSKKNAQLDQLFKAWKKEYGTHENFIKDGIISENRYEKARRKVLFIAKEPNDPDQKATDYREWWNRELRLGFSYRIAEWAYGFLNDFPVYDEIWPKVDGKYDSGRAMEAIQSIAFMNIKKSGGGGEANNNTIDEHLEKYSEHIKEQISIIAPEIIILGLSWNPKSQLIFPGIKWVDCGYQIPIAKYDELKIIDFYHPSARNAAQASYRLLKCVFEGDRFSEL